MIPVSHPTPSVPYVTQPAMPAAVMYDSTLPRSPTALPFPQLPDDWRHSISKSNKYYFWKRGAKSSTFKHPVTGLEYPAVPTGPGSPTEMPTPTKTQPLGSFDGRNGGSPQSLHKEVVKLRIRQESIDERPFDLEAEQDRVIEDYKRGVITAEEYHTRWYALEGRDRKPLNPTTPISGPRDQYITQNTAAPVPAAFSRDPTAYDPQPAPQRNVSQSIQQQQPQQPQQAQPQAQTVAGESVEPFANLGPLMSSRGPYGVQMWSSGAPQYTAKHPDPAPHLNQGLRLPAPGPRINPNPPAPAQHAPMVNMPGVPPVPPPQPPAPMTTLVPAMRDGSHLSPPEGEVVTRHSFDIANRQWVRHQIRVRLDKYPFQEGTLRSVYFMKDLSKPPGPAQDYVAKISKDSKEKHAHYFQDCEMQALAGYIAACFSALPIPKKCRYVEAAVIECHDRVSPTGGRVVFNIEPYIPGVFLKYTNNYGWINPGAPRNTPQAFSHFSHYLSGGTLVVVDVQGITDEDGVDHYTDPQIHTRSDQPAFGKADLRDHGISKFFETHECNSICHALGLPCPGQTNANPPASFLPPPNPNMCWDLRQRKK